MQARPLKEHEAYQCVLLALAENDGGGFFVYFPDLPGCVSDGGTPLEAMQNGFDAVAAWIEANKHWGKKIPKPLFKHPQGGETIKLPDGRDVTIVQSSSRPKSEAEKILAVENVMNSF